MGHGGVKGYEGQAGRWGGRLKALLLWWVGVDGGMVGEVRLKRESSGNFGCGANGS